jgi:cysteine desulfuration protein SufE
MSIESIEATEEELIEEFSIFDDMFDKFGYLIDLGKSLSPMSNELKTENRLIKGCQANVWLYSELKQGKIYFTADADADYAKGLVGMMVRVLSGRTPDEILKAPLTFIEKIGLKNMLSMKRSGGLESMIKQMKLDALAFKTVNK